MASSFAKRLLVLIVSGMLMFATGAEAHPHVWVSVKTTVLFKGSAIVGLQQHWTFDEFYAAMAIEGLDKNNDGAYDLQWAIRTIAALKPDIVGVQELTRNHPYYRCEDQPARIAQAIRCAFSLRSATT